MAPTWLRSVAGPALRRGLTTAAQMIEVEAQHAAHNYAPLPVVLHRGQGALVWDVNGKRYFDFLSAFSSVNQARAPYMIHPSGTACALGPKGSARRSAAAAFGMSFCYIRKRPRQRGAARGAPRRAPRRREPRGRVTAIPESSLLWPTKPAHSRSRPAPFITTYSAHTRAASRSFSGTTRYNHYDCCLCLLAPARPRWRPRERGCGDGAGAAY